MNINVILLLLFVFSVENSQHIPSFEIAVTSGDKSNRKKDWWYLNKEGVINMKLHSNNDYEYKFSKISIQVVYESWNKLLGIPYKKYIDVEEGLLAITQQGYLDCSSCGIHDLNSYINYNDLDWSKTPHIVIPYAKISTHDCLSRIVIKVDEIKYRRNNKEGILKNFRYKKKYSFQARWSKCRDWAENNSKGFIKRS